ncbi:MAG: ATP-dependent RecD-like DNA helicase [Blastocatellales bacterium]
MRNKLQRVAAVITGWLVVNCATRIRHSGLLKRLLFRPEYRKLTTFDESLLQIIKQSLREGHTCLPLKLLMSRAEAELGGGEWLPEGFIGALQRLRYHRRVHVTDSHVALPQCVVAEDVIAKGLLRIGRRARAINSAQLNQFVKVSANELSDEQRDAIRFIANTPVSILTGAPGSGKTATVKALLNMFVQAGYRVRLAAPTGRAAQRLKEVTGHPAQTLHRMLRANQPEARSIWNYIFPVADVIIVDEASMVDVFLMARLVKACSPSTKLILVGDVHQLPSVGAGQALLDLIESGTVPAFELRNNYRQANGSRIVDAAEAIKEGRVPDLPAPGKMKSDCYFIEADTATEISRLVVKAATKSLPARCGANPNQNVQVLTPKHRGLLGTISLNEQIQGGLSDSDLEPPTTAHPFLPGDRVLHTKNNYRLNVFNGQCGSVQVATDDSITVNFGQREVIYSRASLHQLTHGFAISIHRSQGSEYPFVIIPIHETQYPMLSRELLYTAITRGQQMVVLIGSRSALEAAIENSVRGKLHTGLKHTLIKARQPKLNVRLFSS